MSQPEKILFNDLAKQQHRLKNEIDAAVARVFAHGQYILGPEVSELERAIANVTGAKHVITCSSGTDALLLVLLAIGIEARDAVFVPSFTFVSTAEAVALAGAIPVFVDVDPDTYLINPVSLEQAVKQARSAGLNPRAIIPVDLFGQPADYDCINTFAAHENLFVLADAAQSFGGSFNGKPVGTLTKVTATSFFPSKPLGCYGDGGAVFTDDDELASLINSLRVHGKGVDKYDNVRIGINGRLDTLQAAILIEKLKIFEDEMAKKQVIANYYSDALSKIAGIPHIEDNVVSSWAQYTIQVKQRNQIIRELNKHDIPTAIYYPKPLHLQKAYLNYPRADKNLPVSESLAESVLSLPMHPYLNPAQQDLVINTIKQAIKDNN